MKAKLSSWSEAKFNKRRQRKVERSKKRFTDLLRAIKKSISDKILFLVKDRISISVCSLVFWGFRDKSTQKRIIFFLLSFPINISIWLSLRQAQPPLPFQLLLKLAIVINHLPPIVMEISVA